MPLSSESLDFYLRKFLNTGSDDDCNSDSGDGCGNYAILLIVTEANMTVMITNAVVLIIVVLVVVVVVVVVRMMMMMISMVIK